MTLAEQRSALKRRPSGYWKMEVGNVLLVPAIIVWLAYLSKAELCWLTYISLIPMCALLLIGGLYWRAKLKTLHGNTSALAPVLRAATFWQWPLAISSFAVSILVLVSWFHHNLSASMGDRIAASVAAGLAVLEYVNYYHRQLQHFDHLADFRRLISGRGFRRSQMAVDLRRYRSGGVL